VRPGRDETELERYDRNLVELLQEVRVVQTGVQVLFAFLLMAPLTPGFDGIGGREQAEYYLTLVLAGAAAILLIAPTAYHRILFRRGEKEYLITVANRLTLAGLATVGTSMAGAMVFVTDILFGGWAAVAAGVVFGSCCLAFWAALPLARRRSNGVRPPHDRRGPGTPGPRRAARAAARPARH
jgi:Family of unknown function (DUF6328)